MFAMFRQFFTALTVLFSALEKNAKAIENLSTIGEEMSGAYLDASRTERAIAQQAHKRAIAAAEAA